MSLILGTGITVIAAVSPARRASRLAPVEALRDTVAPSVSIRRRVIVGSLLTLAGVGFVGLGLFGHVSNAGLVVGLGAALTFNGVAALSPLFARPAGVGHRPSVPWTDRGQARQREREPEPAAHRLDGRGADDRPRARRVRRGVRRVAQGLRDRDARQGPARRPDAELLAVLAVLSAARAGPREEPRLRGRVPDAPDRDEGRHLGHLRRGDRSRHDREGREHPDGRRVRRGSLEAEHRDRVQDRGRREPPEGRRHDRHEVRGDRHPGDDRGRHLRAQSALQRLHDLPRHLRRERRTDRGSGGVRERGAGRVGRRGTHPAGGLPHEELPVRRK